jgi:DegV family protein with EDD domain
MNVQTLTGEQLFNMFVSGGNTIIENKEDLNKINVFPVPDGDTGTNLASTFYSIMENGKVYPSAGKTMQSIAEEALTGARGNSGIIFAQFLEGLSWEIGEAHTITVDSFSGAVKKAVHSAYEAISNPVEGTMLSVIRDWADSVHTKTKKLRDFHQLFSDSVQTSMKALKETTNKLKDLRDAHVVDAGAKGFVHFLQGALDFVKTGKVVYPEVAHIGEYEDKHEELNGEKKLQYRYCTEALIKGKDIDIQQLKQQLGTFGDSVIVAGSKKTARIHVHTNQPAELLSILREHGAISQQKADDMIRQQEIVYNRKFSIALVTDSACDLPQEIIDTYQIHMVPINITMGEDQYLDKLTITPKQLYGRIDSSAHYPTTSQPSGPVFRNLYSYLSSYYDSIIAIHLSGKLSGTWNISSHEAEKLEDSTVTVIDSKNLSGAQGLIVQRAAEEIASGKPHAKVVEAIDGFIRKTDILVSVQTLAYMVRGGRVSPLKGAVAKLLNLKPIVSIDDEGESVLFGKAFSRKRNRKKIIDMVVDTHSKAPLHSYAVVHAHAPDRAADFAQELEEVLGMPPAYTMDISPVIGLHAGLGAVAVVTMKQ